MAAISRLPCRYIDTFVATSPVWSGAPAALITYTSGYGVPQPPKPPQCKAFTLSAGAVFTGPFEAYFNESLADCCEKTGGLKSTKLFNYFPANTTCHVLGQYVTTAPFDGGILGYDESNEEHAAIMEHSRSEPLHDVPLTPLLTRTIARASPSLMWAFPRAGNESNTSWTNNDPILLTPTKNYTAFDYQALLVDLGLSSAVTTGQLEYLSHEPDLATFASPGVDTFVTYGTGLDTPATAHYNVDFTRQAMLPTATIGTEARLTSCLAMN